MRSKLRTPVELLKRSHRVYENRLSRLSLERQEAVAGWLFVIPKLAIILFAIGGPIVFGLYVSFTDSHLIQIPGEFIGLDNYVWLLGYDVWWLSIRNVILIGLVLIPTNIFFSFTTSVLLLEKLQGKTFYRVAFLIPIAGPPLVWAVVWRLVIFPTEGGIANSILLSIGVLDAPIPFLSRSAYALPSVILTVIWGFGLSMLIYMAAMSNVPSSLIEAAKLDGAGRLQRIRYILWPVMKPTTLFLVVIHVIVIFQFGFAAVFVLTGGGPGSSTMIPSYFIYTLAFSHHEMGRAAAGAFVLFGLTAIATFLSWKLLGSRVRYDL